MEIISLDIIGTAPLMINSPRGIDPRDPISKQLKLITSKGKDMTDADHETVLRLKFEQAFYPDVVTDGPCLPAYNILTSIQKAAGLSRKGKTIERGVHLACADKLPIEFNGPRDLEGMWNDGIADTRPVKPQNAGAVLGCRPLFRDWKITGFDVLLDPSQINQQDFLGHAALAGRVMGTGTYRRRYGRFMVYLGGREIDLDGSVMTVSRPKGKGR